MDAHDRIPPDSAISRHDSPSGVRRRSLPEHSHPDRSMGTGIQPVFILAREGTLGPPPLFEPSQQPPRRPPATCGICLSEQPTAMASGAKEGDSARSILHRSRPRHSEDGTGRQQGTRIKDQGSAADHQPNHCRRTCAAEENLHLHPGQGRRPGRCTPAQRPSPPLQILATANDIHLPDHHWRLGPPPPRRGPAAAAARRSDGEGEG
jgi:hypothetical protein